MFASHRQPTFRDRRWTKYSNLEERIGRHPLPQMSKLKDVCALCHAVGFDLFCPPVSTLGRRKQLRNLGGAGDKVVQGLNNLSIYCSAEVTLACPLLESSSDFTQVMNLQQFTCHAEAMEREGTASLEAVYVGSVACFSLRHLS